MRRWIGFLFAALALLALALSVRGDVALVARGWTCAFVLVSMIPIGSLALLLAHGLTGGRWGRELAPVLVPAARSIPMLFAAFLPVIVLRPLIYDWHALTLPHDVLALYLNPGFFELRTLIGLAIWSALAWGAAWRNPLFSALGLFAHLILTMLLPADWILTLAPGSVMAGFGWGFAIEQMFAALAFVAVLAPQSPGRPNRDLTGLLLSALLGTVYFFYVQFFITWYGNIPAKVHWFASRTGDGWPQLMFAAFLLGAAAPFLAILSPTVRREPKPLRVVGFLVLLGIVLHVSWLTLPAFGATAILPFVFAALLLALALIEAGARLPGDAHAQ